MKLLYPNPVKSAGPSPRHVHALSKRHMFDERRMYGTISETYSAMFTVLIEYRSVTVQHNSKFK